MRSLLYLYSLLFASSLAYAQSVLSSGEWHKIGITEDGAYKVDYQYITKTLGISTAGLDPRTIQVYGIGGGMLPQANGIQRSNDPQELSVYQQGFADGTLDPGDFLLFYGDGPHELTTDGAHVHHEVNIYTDTAYYFITHGLAVAQTMEKIESTPSLEGSSTYTHYITRQEENYNVLNSGRTWFDSEFRPASPNKFLSFKSKNTGSVDIWISVASTSSSPSSFDISLNGSHVANTLLPRVPAGLYADSYITSQAHYNTTLSSEDININLDYNTEDGTGYLDYIVFGIQRKLDLADGAHYLYSDQDQALQVLNTSSDLLALDVSDSINPSIVSTSSGKFNAFKSRKYLVLDKSSVTTPKYFHAIPNQDIKSLTGGDGLIISHANFLTEARRLADFHQQHSGMNVTVVDVHKIYNEFASGREDITAIRDFIRYLYQNGPLKYVLLFGDGSYDYKRRTIQDQDFIPVYESRESSHTIMSYSSDDYYGFMEDHEGEWYEGNRLPGKNPTGYVDHTLDIGVGRLPVKTAKEARDVVDKIIRYKTAPQSLGSWRKKFIYFADDGDSNQHMRQAEDFIDILQELDISSEGQKFYLDMFDQSGDPLVNNPAQDALTQALNDGAFLLDYMGHGNPLQLTDITERVITKSFISNLTNRHKLPLMVAATCDFGQYDNPATLSGGESFLLSRNGGAIALICTTRKVYAHTNYPLNQSLHYALFNKIDGKYPRLGDIMKFTKNASLLGPVNRNFSLLGDPMLQLNYPGYEVELNDINTSTDTLSALEVVKVTGQILDNNQTVQNFNGTAEVTLWDIPKERKTLGNESDPFVFQVQDNALFRGKTLVKNGLFELELILPKNTTYEYKNARLTVYAWNIDELRDASGGSTNILLGGTADIVEDDQPPQSKVFLNDESFRNGHTVGTNSLLIAKLYDDNGINISSNGFNSGMTLQIDNHAPINVGSYYSADIGSYKAGTLTYPLLDLEPGKHTAHLKVRDSYNNLTESLVEFKVSNDAEVRIFNSLVFPNPAATNGSLNLAFEHDREGEHLSLEHSLVDMNGTVVYSNSQELPNSSRDISINLNLNNIVEGAIIPGMYVYHVRIISQRDGAYNDMFYRLFITN